MHMHYPRLRPDVQILCFPLNVSYVSTRSSEGYVFIGQSSLSNLKGHACKCETLLNVSVDSLVRTWRYRVVP